MIFKIRTPIAVDHAFDPSWQSKQVGHSIRNKLETMMWHYPEAIYDLFFAVRDEWMRGSDETT